VSAPSIAGGPGDDLPWDLHEPAQRRYFDRYGRGLVMILPPQREPPPTAAGAGGRPAMPHGGAWLHVGGDGRAHAFSGKVEVGQGTRAALALLVAEELRLPLERVSMVMGDTDVTPWDIGTFGSLAMPTAAQHLRLAAAAAREALIDLAAARLGCDRGALAARNGRVMLAAPADAGSAGAVAGDARALDYGGLVAGIERVELVPAGIAPTPAAAWTVAGRDGGDHPARLEMVTGVRRFVTDLRRDEMWQGRILHPPSYGATLRAADLSAAAAMPDVAVVREDGFIGAAAPTAERAAAALRAIHAEWDSPRQPTEAEIVDYLRAHPAAGEGFWGATHQETGDVDAALAAAPLRLDATYTTAYVAHVALECRCAVAEWRGGRVEIEVGTQTPFHVREHVAEALGLDEGRVRIVVPPTGSGFGGKHGGDIAEAAARLARASGRPVRVAFTREEEMVWGGFRPMAVIDVSAGADADGTLTAWSFRNLNSGSAGIAPPYRIPNQRLDHQPAESPLPQGSYRALAATANHFARESHIDELAVRLGIDPVSYRLRLLADERLAAVLRAVAERAGWAARRREPGRGFGIACGLEKGGRVATFVDLRAPAGGPVEIARVVTGFECGAIVHPESLLNQVEGATIMGIGAALFEAVRFGGGRVLTPRLSSYRVPRFRDVPPLEVLLLDRKDLPSSGGGETPLVAIAPAIANAIRDATGERLRALPLALSAG
jgi:isoquinoline 1-oxidoreductase